MLKSLIAQAAGPMRNYFSAIHVTQLESILGQLLFLPLVTCPDASSSRDVVSIVVEIEDFSTGRVSDVEVLDLTGVPLTSRISNCADDGVTYDAEALEVPSNRVFIGSLIISVENDRCIFTANAIPNHDMNDDSFRRTSGGAQSRSYSGGGSCGGSG